MGQDKEATRRGWLYYWANEEEMVMRVPCEVYSRIVGYIRPLRNWNEGKKQEYEERQEYKVEVIE